MNPRNWPQGVKVSIGGLLTVGMALLPFLAKSQGLPVAWHATIISIAATWLLLVNTWNSTSGEPPIVTAREGNPRARALRVSMALALQELEEEEPDHEHVKSVLRSGLAEDK